MLARSINLLASTGPISTLRKLGCRNETTQILSGAIAAKPFFAVLNDRSVIQVKGPDALEFIQGLCTNDLHKLDCDDRSSCAQYAAFLAPKGRILAESIIHAVAKDEFLIDVESSRLSALGKHLLQYKVRRNATVKNAKDLYEVRAVLGGTHGSAPGFEDENKVVCSTIDPRWNGLGERGIFRKAEDSAWDTKEMTNLGFIQKTSEDYNKFCSRVGIGQGSELADLIPLQTNLDMLNGVSFSKGCYLGQELVARSHFKGTIRKRILPVEISSLPGGPEDDVHVRFPTPVMLDSRKIGKLLGQHGQYGVALLAIEHFVTDDGEFETQANDRELHTDTHKIVVKGLPPYWDNAYVD